MGWFKIIKIIKEMEDEQKKILQQKERNYQRFNNFLIQNEGTMYNFLKASKEIEDIQQQINCNDLKEFCDKINADSKIKKIKLNLVMDSQSSDEFNKCFLIPEMREN